MAQKVTVELVDDMSPEQVAAETVSFGLDGVTYEIDLSEKNAASIRAKLQPFIDAGRRVGRVSRGAGPVKVAARDDLDAIRIWAKAKGKKVADRGRIAHEIMDEYDADKAKPAKVAAPVMADAPAKKAAPAAAKKEPAAQEVKSPAFSG